MLPSYVRLSKEDGDVSTSAKAESNSISNQKDFIRNFLADKKDIRIVKEYVDDGYSGSNFDRPSFQTMMEDIKRGVIDCVVVKDLSRFGREYIDSGRYIERLFPALGVRFIAINDSLITAPCTLLIFHRCKHTLIIQLCCYCILTHSVKL